MSETPLSEVLEYVATKLYGMKRGTQQLMKLCELITNTPPWLLTGDGALRTIELMNTRGYDFDILIYQDGISVRCWNQFRARGTWGEGTWPLPEAIQRGAYAALKKAGEKP